MDVRQTHPFGKVKRCVTAGNAPTYGKTRNEAPTEGCEGALLTRLLRVSATPSDRTGYRTSMIDLAAETLIPLRDVPRHLPTRSNGKRIHISACYRWMSRGVKGVVLESLRIGGSTYTSREALQRFAERLGAASNIASTGHSSLTKRQRQIDDGAQRIRQALRAPGKHSE